MIVIADKPGQLANRLFVFAHFIAWAVEHGFSVANPSFDEYGEFFRATCRDVACRYPAKMSFIKPNNKIRSLLFALTHRAGNSLLYRAPSGRLWEATKLGDQEICELTDARFLHLARTKKLVFVQGWLFRDHANLEKHADLVRKHFEPIQAIQDKICALVQRFRRDCDVLVGVHIRQGDYRQHFGGKYFYSLCQYVALMQQVRKLFPRQKVSFLISSNENQVVEESCGLRCVYGTRQPVEDLYLLAQCDYIIGPPSTYNMWASFFGSVPLYTIEDPSAELKLDRFFRDSWRGRRQAAPER